jgi:Spy/CpxP family protein refolding chaperone
MSFLRHWQIVLLLVAIFLVGAVSVALLTARAVKRAAASPTAPQNLVATAARYYQRELELTPEQVEQLRPIFIETARDIGRARREMYQSMQRMHGEMEQMLTPEQKEKFQELRERAKARIKSHLENALPARNGTPPP